MKQITATDPNWIRENAHKSIPVQSHEQKPTPNHKFSIGETATLVGLVDFPEFNGTTVEITGVREDGPNGRAYYIKGELAQFLNWTYEYRLQKTP